MIDIDAEELCEGLEDRLAVSAVAVFHVPVQRVQALVAGVAKVALDLRTCGSGLKSVVGVDEGDVDGEEVLPRGAEVADGTPKAMRCDMRRF